MLNFDDDDDDNRGEDANLTINVVGIEDNLLYYNKKSSGSYTYWSRFDKMDSYKLEQKYFVLCIIFKTTVLDIVLR